MAQIPEHILQDEEKLVPITDEQLRTLQQKAQELVVLTREIEELESQLSVKKARKLTVEQRELPDMFENFRTDSIGIPEFGCDVVASNYVRASIAAGWAEDRREAAFKWLTDNGHGDVISVNVSVAFKRGEKELADSLVQLINTSFPGANSNPVTINMAVHHGTLTSLVKEQLEQGEAVPLETLGANTGTVAKIVKRKKR